MKKAISLVLSLVLLISAASALAESPAETVEEAAENLLFHTENVTLSGEAAFSLDGVEFKTAKVTVIRDREDSFLDLKLHTPGRGLPDNDKPIDSGYTVTGKGEMIWVTEVMNPGVYKIGYIFPRTTVLRQSVQLDLITRLARNLAQQADTLLGEGAVTEAAGAEGGKEIRIALDENVPDLVNTALTMAFQSIVSRYFGVDYDQLSSRFTGSVENYYTVTSGIVYTTEYLYLKQADVSVLLDAADELTGVSGTFSANLQAGGEGHRLDITFRLDVSARGSSKVEDFSAEGLVPANSYTLSQGTEDILLPEEETETQE